MRGKKALDLLTATLPGMIWHQTHGRDELGNNNHNARFEVEETLGESVYVAIEEVRVDPSTYSTNQHTYRVEVGCYIGEAVGILHAAQRVRERLGLLHRSLDRALAPVRPTQQRQLGVTTGRTSTHRNTPPRIEHTELAEPTELRECLACGKSTPFLDELGQCLICMRGRGSL